MGLLDKVALVPLTAGRLGLPACRGCPIGCARGTAARCPSSRSRSASAIWWASPAPPRPGTWSGGADGVEREFALAQLSAALGRDMSGEVRPVLATSWGTDPHFLGSYAYARVGHFERAAGAGAPARGRTAGVRGRGGGGRRPGGNGGRRLDHRPRGGPDGHRRLVRVSRVASRAGVLTAPGFLRLWVAGAIASAMMWLEVLAAALFTLAATGSPLDVALVSAARAGPLLLVGAFVGVAADAWDRKRIVLGGLLLTACSSATVALLAASGVLRPWHLGLAALVSGMVYATELPARRRLIVDVAGGDRVGRAVAVDSLTSFATRVLGPLLGGAGVGLVGVGGAYGVSAACSLVAAAIVAGVAHRQEVRALSVAGALRDLRQGLGFARGARPWPGCCWSRRR